MNIVNQSIVQKVKALIIAIGVLLICNQVYAGHLYTGAMQSKEMGIDLSYNIYLPDGYEKTDKKFPVIYLLHGASGNQNDWNHKGGAVETLDGLIRRGLIRESIVVMPSIGPQSWFVDGQKHKMESAIIKEFIPYIESRYRGSSARKDRSVAGLSMGGYGALNLSLKHPNLFCSAGIISPAIYDPVPPASSASRKAEQFMVDGRFSEEIWKEHNYPSHLEKYSNQKSRVSMWIVTGDHDRLGIALMSTQLYWKLYGIQPKDVELRIIDGDHEWMVFRDALSDALQYMDKKCNAIK